MISIAHISKQGNFRHENQDRANIWVSKEHVYCLFVADGMGGHVGGKEASRIVEESIREQFLQTSFLNKNDSQIFKIIYEYILNAQKQLIAFGKQKPQFNDMGTTIVLAILLNEQKVFIYHAGDSRAYLLDHANSFRQVTIDHNLKNYSHHSSMSQNSLLIHALGPEKFSGEDDIKNSCQLFDVDNAHEFIIYLTTDGTLNVLSDIDFYQQLTAHQSLETIANKIVDSAIEHGATDNCSVAILKYEPNNR